MSRLPQLGDCDCYTEITDSGTYIGRVRQYPDIRTRPQKTSLDAIDEVMSLLRNKIARLTAESERLADGTWPPADSTTQG